MPVRVKICGITNLDDALAATEAGADAVGFIFYKKSPRNVSVAMAAKISKALPPFVTRVGVFVDESEKFVNAAIKKVGLDVAQLHGGESVSYCSKINARVVKVFRVKDDKDIAQIGKYRKADAFLLDTYKEGRPGGTGETFNWDLAVKVKKYGRIILSGGLTPQNAATAVKKVKPYALDVCSGVELKPGKKDLLKLKEFIREAKGA